jgi:hypothetical protein
LERHITAGKVYLFQEVDRRGLQMVLIECARIVEWALIDTPSQPSDNWASLQRKMDRKNVSL